MSNSWLVFNENVVFQRQGMGAAILGHCPYSTHYALRLSCLRVSVFQQQADKKVNAFQYACDDRKRKKSFFDVTHFPINALFIQLSDSIHPLLLKEWPAFKPIIVWGTGQHETNGKHLNVNRVAIGGPVPLAFD